MENSLEILGLPIRKGHHSIPAIKVSWDFCTVKLYTLCYSLCFTRYSNNLNRETQTRLYFHYFQIKVLNDNIYIKVPFIKQSVFIHLRCMWGYVIITYMWILSWNYRIAVSFFLGNYSCYPFSDRDIYLWLL